MGRIPSVARGVALVADDDPGEDAGAPIQGDRAALDEVLATRITP